MLPHRITLVDPCLNANHLCHHSLCIKENHISIEPHSENDNMQFYIIQNIWFGHGEYTQWLLGLKKKNCKNLNFSRAMFNNLFRIIVLISDGHQRQLAVITSVVSCVMVSRSFYHCVRRDVSRQIVDTA